MSQILPKTGLRLHKIGSKYMIVDSSSENVNLANVYSLNETAAWIWEKASSGAETADTLADAICQEFDIDRETALNDVIRQLQEWRGMGLIQNP